MGVFNDITKAVNMWLAGGTLTSAIRRWTSALIESEMLNIEEVGLCTTASNAMSKVELTSNAIAFLNTENGRKFTEMLEKSPRILPAVRQSILQAIKWAVKSVGA